jgi:hypothetical protein
MKADIVYGYDERHFGLSKIDLSRNTKNTKILVCYASSDVSLVIVVRSYTSHLSNHLQVFTLLYFPGKFAKTRAYLVWIC